MRKLDINDIQPRLGEEILKELSQYIELPSYGVVGGQAIASLIIRRMGKNNVGAPINDIDIFIPMPPNAKITKKMIQKNEDKINPTLTVSEVIFNSATDYINSSISINKNYKIINSERYGIRNTIYIEMLGSLSGLYKIQDPISSYIVSKKIIDDFDINGVQCGIDLVSKKLYATKNFIAFIKSMKLEITNYKTPVHSIIRLEDKKREMNIQAESELCSTVVSKMLEINEKYYKKELFSQKENMQIMLENMGVYGGLERIKIEQPFIFNFGQTYYKKYNKNKKNIEKAFYLQEREKALYDIYSLGNKEAVLTNLDDYIHKFINSALYEPYGDEKLLNRFERHNILLKNLSPIIKRTIVHKNYYFMDEQSIKTKSRKNMSKQQSGFRKIEKRILNIQVEEPWECLTKYTNEIYDKSQSSFIYNNMNNEKLIYWHLVLLYTQEIIQTNVYKILIEGRIDLKNTTEQEYVDFLMAKNIQKVKIDRIKNFIQSMNLEIDNSTSLREYIGEYRLIVNNIRKKIQEIKIIKSIEKEKNINAIKYILEEIIDGDFEDVNSYVVLALIEKSKYKSINLTNWIIENKKHWDCKELIKEIVVNTITTYAEYELISKALEGSKIGKSELNKWLIENQTVEKFVKEQIIENLMNKLNKSSGYSEGDLLLFESIIINNKKDERLISEIIGALKNKNLLLMIKDLINKELNEEMILKLAKITKSKEMDFYIKNEDFKNTLSKINFY